MFKKVLVANRGEIAIRIFRACKELEINTAAVYSDVDRVSLHLRYADEAHCIGGSPASESYLNIEKIVTTAKKIGADAIHPGYGFLAENPDFVKRCEEEGIVFIGPSSEAVRAMGIKTTARRTMMSAGIPVIPASDEINTLDEALAAAGKIGYPVIIKAVAGGGGKGMRMVRVPEEMEGALRAVSSESESSFGSLSLYIEKYMDKARHIEIQIMGDKKGNIIHLNERECSVQRRYQKLIEESPSVIVDDRMRREMGEVAIKAARVAGYHNAGSVEFLVDKNRDFYFLEMNTRLQVEHAVTEMITGIDIVQEMISVAAGNSLNYSQEDVRINGAAIECRIYAEDPYNDFLPSPGVITFLRTSGGFGIRRDSGIYQGVEVTIFYDPLIAKIISWGRDRDEARIRMYRALKEYTIRGIKTTIPFHQRVMHHPDFVAGNLDINFIDRKLSLNKAPTESPLRDIALISSAIAAHLKKSKVRPISPERVSTGSNMWRMAGRRGYL